MYYTIWGAGCSEEDDEITPFETKEAAVKFWVAQADAIINEIVRRGYRPKVMTCETLYNGRRAYELSFVALFPTKNVIMDSYYLWLTKD